MSSSLVVQSVHVRRILWWRWQWKLHYYGTGDGSHELNGWCFFSRDLAIRNAYQAFWDLQRSPDGWEET